MKHYLYIILFLTFGLFSSFKAPKKPVLKWYEWNEGYALAMKQNKPVFVHVFTSWCPYCKLMDKETYIDKELIGMLNGNFINIRFNPENNKEMYKMDKYVLNGNQLLLLIGNKKLTGYPGTVFIFPGGKGIFVKSGYQKPDEMKQLVTNVLNKKGTLQEDPALNGNSNQQSQIQSPNPTPADSIGKIEENIKHEHNQNDIE